MRVKVFETLIDTLRGALDSSPKGQSRKAPAAVAETPPSVASDTILDRVDLSLTLERDDYEKQLDQLQERLFRLEHEMYVARVPAVIVYEGWDASGKGGNIRRLTRDNAEPVIGPIQLHVGVPHHQM